jgi:xylulokinase
MSWCMGIDASTQSMSVVVIDTETGEIVCDEGMGFGEFPEYKCPDGFLLEENPLVKHADPLVWVAALDALFDKLKSGGFDFGRVQAVSGSGQQHGTVYLNNLAQKSSSWSDGESLVDIVKPMLSLPTAPIWMDSSTSEECREITDAAGGDEYVQKTTGSPAIERFSGPQIRRVSKKQSVAYENTAVIHLVSSFVASVFAGESVAIDVGDGAGMNLMDLETSAWDSTMLEATAPGLGDKLPPVVASEKRVGNVSSYFVDKYGFAPETAVIAFSGDNPNSLIGVGGYKPGTAVISLGTSHTYFAAMNKPLVDPDGYGHVFGNPAGGFMSLICFKNGALAQEEVRKKAGLDWKQFDDCLRATPAGNNGNMMLPYFVPEITPVVLEAGPVFHGTDEFVVGTDTAARVRAVVEAQALRLRIHSAWIERRPSMLRVTGGASKSDEVCQVLADVFNARVERLSTGNSAGLGAAMRAAQGIGAGDWATLTEAYSTTETGGAVEANPENVKVYDSMIAEFAKFANQELRT